ncbi:MAG: NosD domain-containing protein [Candidatus Bathyarchaeia archaeon]
MHEEIETIYILPDGSVSPTTPLIVHSGDLYSLVGNVNATIIVQKSGITFDGDGYRLYGNNTPYGVAVSGFVINGVNNVTITHTQIINYSYGVLLQNTMYSNITNNYFDYDNYAIGLHGNADFNTIVNNTIMRGLQGVYTDYGFNNNSTIICNNIANLGSGVGINLMQSAGNIIQANTLDHNNKGINLYQCTNSVVSDNIMTYIDQAGIHLVESDRNKVNGNKINRTRYAAGISMYASSENIVSGNELWYNEEGIRVESVSTLNTVFGNNLTYNDYGIKLYNHADNNTFYHNNFVYSIDYQVFFLSNDNLYNKWNSSTSGNYWSDYTSVDANSDGIGDTPYQINTENIDYYPLITPFQRQPHEITLLSVSTSKVLTRMGKPVIIDVMVENTGEYPEKFNVTVYAENIVIGTKLVSLDAQTIEKVSFLWQTGGFQPKNYVIRSTITGFSQEMQVINNGMGSMQPMTVMGDGCCILVAGSKPDDEIVGINNYGVNQVYKILRQVGYTGEDIYMMHQPRYNPEDVDGDGQNDVDANSTVANLRWAIESWASSRVSPTAPLFIYLLDHGGSFEFCINPDEVVRPHFMTNWINNLETTTNASVHVIYAACYSGTFINSLSKSGRIIVTSCDVSQSSWVIGGWEQFSTPFWNTIKSGHSIMDAFNYACQRMASPGQTPLLDDNGDRIGHCGYLPNNGDGALAANTYIGHCEWPYPWISYAIAKQTFTWPPPSSVTLWAKIENKTNLAHVAVHMQPPDWSPPNPNGTLVVPNFERFEMTDPDHDGNWTVTIPSINFTSHASGVSKFIFLIMAEEENGDAATPEIIEVEFTASGFPSDDTELPKVYVERPLEESVVYGTIKINGTATDNLCLQKMELYIDSNLVDTLDLSSYSVSYFSFNFNTTTLENGATEILVKVYDSTGNTSNQSLTVYVNNFIHDAVVTNLTPSSNLVNHGETVKVSVTVANHGAYTETLNITIYANAKAVASHVLTLEPGIFATISLVWNTTGFDNGNYILNAKISPVISEIDTTNNDLTLTEEPLIIIPEFPSTIILPMLIILMTLAIIFVNKKKLKSP